MELNRNKRTPENLSALRAVTLSDDFREYSQQEKIAWAKEKATENANYLSSNLGYVVSDRLPYVLLQAATEVLQSIHNRKKLKTRICDRADHYANTMKVLATAILHYDLASNLVGVRDRVTHKLERCDNKLFADRLNMPSRTVDNCIYSLKRAGLYLSFEQREEKETDVGRVYRGVASIKRLNMVIFEMLGLGQFVTVQRAKAKQRKQIKQLEKTPEQEQLDSYRKADDNILFIDASAHCGKATNQNYLREEDLERILDAVEKREQLEPEKADKFSYVATIEEIKTENDFNLNIPRYVDTFEEEEIIELSDISEEIQTINKEMEELDCQLESFCNELSIVPPTGGL